MELGEYNMYVRLKRDRSKCTQCLRCNYAIHGFSNMTCIQIHESDYEKEEVKKAVASMILVCESDAIAVE